MSQSEKRAGRMARAQVSRYLQCTPRMQVLWQALQMDLCGLYDPLCPWADDDCRVKSLVWKAKMSTLVHMCEESRLIAELQSFSFPDCGLRHEQLKLEVRQTTVLLPVINTSHLNSLCAADVKLHRPACPHFNDAREGNDPIEEAYVVLGRHHGHSFREEILAYRALRQRLVGIDHSIRATRKHIHNLACRGKYATVEVLCNSVREGFLRHNAGILPHALIGISDMGGMEQALLTLHAEIRGTFQEITSGLVRKLQEVQMPPMP